MQDLGIWIGVVFQLLSGSSRRSYLLCTPHKKILIAGPTPKGILDVAVKIFLTYVSILLNYAISRLASGSDAWLRLRLDPIDLKDCPGAWPARLCGRGAFALRTRAAS